MSQKPVEDIDNVINLIYKGKINHKQAKVLLNEIENKYDRPFLLAKPIIKERPWDKKYLKELKRGAENAYRSKECLIHFAKVADDVYAQRRRKQKSIGIIIGISAVVSIIIAIIVIMNKR